MLSPHATENNIKVQKLSHKQHVMNTVMWVFYDSNNAYWNEKIKSSEGYNIKKCDLYLLRIRENWCMGKIKLESMIWREIQNIITDKSPKAELKLCLLYYHFSSL